MSADHGYVFKGISGWSIAFAYRTEDTKFFHGFTTWDAALAHLKLFWCNAPDYQNGFPARMAS